MIKYPETYIARTNQKQPQQTNNQQPTSNQQPTTNKQPTTNNQQPTNDAIVCFHLFKEELLSQYFVKCQGASVRKTGRRQDNCQGIHAWKGNGG